MIVLRGNVEVKVGGNIILTHNYYAKEFTDFIASLLEYGTQKAGVYTQTGTVEIPSGVMIQLLNASTPVALVTAKLLKWTYNSVLYTATDNSNNTYSFNNIVMWAVDAQGVLLYPIAFVNLQQLVTKQSATPISVEWLLSWILSSNLTQLNIPVPPAVKRYLSSIGASTQLNCNTPLITLYMLLLLGVTPTTDCLYQSLANVNLANVGGVSLILLFDSAGNVVGQGNTNPSQITPSGTPVTMACYESIDTNLLPLAYGAITGSITGGNEAFGCLIQFKGDVAQLFTPPPGYYTTG